MMLWLLLAAAPARCQELELNREYEVKAVFLLNFTRFIDWPQHAFASTDSPFIIGVLGVDPFELALDEVVRGERVGARPLQVQRFRQVEEIGSCHMLFISRSELPNLDRILRALNGRPILTVGDADGFARSGGMIRLDTVAGKIRLSINLEASKRAGLTFSSRLLRPAEIVAARGRSEQR